MPKDFTRRELVGVAAAAAAAPSLFDAARASAIQPSRRTNIVYIHSHDSGRYLSPYGYAVPTPRLLGLAREGVLFRQMHCASPSCSASRAAMLTGQSSHSSGMLGLTHRGWDLAHPERHLVHTLGRAGYATMLAGLQHVARDAASIGYSQILPHQSNMVRDVAPGAAAFLRSPAAKAQPFFLDIGFEETHRPLHPAVDDPAFILPPAPIPDTPESRRDMAEYHASARALDKGVGLILDALQAAGLADNTLVISTTDHGLPFPTMKGELRDGGTGVSMIMRGPGAFAGPKVSDALLSQIDLFPTLCEYLGIAPPDWLEGQSYLPVVDGRKAEVNEAIFTELTFHAAYEPKRAVRTQRYKYIRRFDGRRTPVVVNCDGGLTKAQWLKRGWAGYPLVADEAGEELFDLHFDPTEQRNLVALPELAPVLEDMRSRLSEWMRRTQDPLLDGPVAVPPGVRSDPPDPRPAGATRRE
ncbi:sulfatase [Sphingopyxis sp. JAI108]|uniref:sulfatase family protein n=1 Tax=Sphingopyxis sp. JAI108 TaxID=2723060 RepID=UPI0015C95537|nr:sulfatase [Sphingopyxis sp. JAI108]NYF34055.1 arylsulfatase A-like enzyme [Sphingopyxis sp. JAI108]